MTPLTLIASELGEIVQRKRQQYGDSIASSGQILRIMFPRGASPTQLDEVLLIARTLDKLQRIATGSASDAIVDLEEPWNDIAGYGICGVAQQRERTSRERNGNRCASASSQVAGEESTEPRASAASDVNGSTTTSANGTSAQPSAPPWMPPSPGASAATDAFARTARVDASVRQAVLLRGAGNNQQNRCAWCNLQLLKRIDHTACIAGDVYSFDSANCAWEFMETSS